MSKVKREVEKKVMQIEYMSCRKEQHQGQDLSMVCLNMECQGKRVLCCHCQESQHQQHHVLPLKEYLMQIYTTRFDSVTQIKSKMTQLPFGQLIEPQNNNSNENPQYLQTNYLSFLYQVQNHKISALKSIEQIKQKFLHQLTDIQTEIQMTTSKYMEKIRVISEINFGKLDLIDKINKFTSENSNQNLNSLLELYLNNYNITNIQQKSQQQIDKLIAKNKKPHISIHEQTHQQLIQIQQSFKNQIKNFQNTLKNFDLKFIPKLSKLLTYEDIKFKYFSSVYQWDPYLKSKNFEIDSKNNKILRSLKNTVGCERFAFMKRTFPAQSKVKFRWAIKINNLAGWISVGVGLKKVVQQAQLKFNYSTIGHGSYMISDNGYSWSHSSSENNSKKQSFNFVTGDTIILQFDPNQKELRFKKISSKSPQQNFILSIAQYTDTQKLSPCVNMCSPKDQIQIVSIPS